VLLPKVLHAAMFAAIVKMVEDVVSVALRVIISVVVEEVSHGYQALSIGYAVIHLLSHPV
jgi:hypothetical protein